MRSALKRFWRPFATKRNCPYQTKSSTSCRKSAPNSSVTFAGLAKQCHCIARPANVTEELGADFLQLVEDFVWYGQFLFVANGRQNLLSALRIGFHHLNAIEEPLQGRDSTDAALKFFRSAFAE